MRKFLLLAMSLMYSTSVYSMDDSMVNKGNINGKLVIEGGASYVLTSDTSISMGASGVIENYSSITIDDPNAWDNSKGTYAEIAGLEGSKIINHDGFSDVVLDSSDTRYAEGSFSKFKERTIPFLHKGINVDTVSLEFAASDLLNDVASLTSEQKASTLYDLTTVDVGNDNLLEELDNTGQNVIELHNTSESPVALDCNFGCIKQIAAEGEAPLASGDEREVINIKVAKGEFDVSGDNSLYKDGVAQIAPGGIVNLLNAKSTFQSDILLLPTTATETTKASLKFNAASATTYEITKTLDAKDGIYEIAPDNTVVISKNAKIIS